MTRARLAAIAVAAALAAAAPGPAHAAAPAHAGRFLVGAATADITPPRAGRAGDPANCDPTGAFDGPRAVGLEEPYKDLNGNGRYDTAPDKGGPEPFLDCPTPTANGGLTPPDGRWDGIYLGGGDCCAREVQKVLDPIGAQTVVIGNGRKRISITTVDNEGVFKAIWDEVRRKVRADGVRLDQMFFASDHDESAPDTIGISGPSAPDDGIPTQSSVDPFYVEFMVRRVAGSIERAAAHTEPATIRFGQAQPANLVPCPGSYPLAADAQVGAMQAVGTDGRVIATLVNYGSHAEDLGFAGAYADDLSADWPGFARADLHAAVGGVVLTMAGANGSIEMPDLFTQPLGFTRVAPHGALGRDCGHRAIYAEPGLAETVPNTYDGYTRALGRAIAGTAQRALASGSVSRSDRIAFARKALFVPLDNALLQAAAAGGLLPYKPVYVDGVRSPQAPDGSEIGDEVRTEVAWYQVGDGRFVTVPGEVFPVTYEHDFAGPDDLAHPEYGPVHGWVMARLGGHYRFIEGLGEDMLGYLFPRNEAVAVPSAANEAGTGGSSTDRFGCPHDDDAESASPQAGDLVDDAILSILPPAPRDRVAAGRYVYSDGTLHRDPMGDGGLGCDARHAAFTPAPGGGAVGVWLAGGGRTLRPGRGGVRWMDLRGRPQDGGPTPQTRGVIAPSGERIWLDVFPAVPAAPARAGTAPRRPTG